MDYFENIEAYCEGSLDESAKIAFEKAMATDIDLAAAVSLYPDGKRLAEGLLEMDIMGVIDELEKGEKGSSNKKNDTNLFTLKRMAIAASIIGILSFGWWMMQDKVLGDDELYTVLVEKHRPIWPTKRGSVDDSSILERAVLYYQADDMDAAKELLLDSIAKKEVGKYWLAEMYMSKGQIDSTLAYLPPIQDFQKKKNTIIYLKMLIALKKGDRKKAKEYCKQLPPQRYEETYKRLGLD